MANNRMYIYCPVCGHSLFISSHFCQPWQIDGEHLERMNDFMSDHHYSCVKDHSEGVLFEFRYESAVISHDPWEEDKSKIVPDWSKASHNGEKKWIRKPEYDGKPSILDKLFGEGE